MLDFEQSSLDELVQPAVLVTIICEAVLKDSVVGLLKNLKVKGYTVTEARGEGRYEALRDAKSDSETGEETLVASVVETQVEVRALVSKDLSNVILHALKEQQKNFAIMAYRQTVEALASD
jgi:nitrogen regulatory protein PII